MLKRKNTEEGLKIVRLKEEIADKEHNIEELKNDIHVFQTQIYKIKEECGDWVKGKEEAENRLKNALSLGDLEISELKKNISELKVILETEKRRGEEYRKSI